MIDFMVFNAVFNITGYLIHIAAASAPMLEPLL